MANVIESNASKMYALYKLQRKKGYLAIEALTLCRNILTNYNYLKNL